MYGNDEKEIEYLQKNNCKYYSLNLKSKKNIISNYNKLKKFIKKERFDIIHTHGIIPDFYISLMKIDSKKVNTIHNNLYEDYKSNYGIKRYIMIPIQIHAFKKMDKCICCAKNIYEIMQKKLKNACYVRNGIEDKKVNKLERNKLKIKTEDIVYLYAGNFSKRKRVLELIEFFEKVHKPNEILLMLGDGELKEQCIKHKSHNIRILEFVNNPTDYMDMADIYISNSESEGFSISIIEALQSKCYLLLSNIPAHKECFEIDKNYYIGELFNKENLDEKIEILREKIKIENKEELQEFQNKYLSNEVMAKEYIEEYKKL